MRGPENRFTPRFQLPKEKPPEPNPENAPCLSCLASPYVFAPLATAALGFLAPEISFLLTDSFLLSRDISMRLWFACSSGVGAEIATLGLGAIGEYIYRRRNNTDNS